MPARPADTVLASALTALTLTIACPLAEAQQTAPYEGFLCCSMLSSGSWISDLNYEQGSNQIVPAGTPVKFTGFGRWRMLVEIDGKKLGLGNDYSRTMSMDDFAALYVLKEDPRKKIQVWPAKVREAVAQRKVARGMTREQVVVALGHPTTSYTPEPGKPLWNYRIRAGDFQVFFTDDWRVDRLFGAPEVRTLMWLD